MSNECENLYKICRTSAGLTQEQAAELLAVSQRTLSEYENGRARVPDDIVAAMVEVYNSPLIAYYHLKHFSPLGRYLPDIQEPKTNGDMAFQTIIARDELDPAVECIKKIVADGIIDRDEGGMFAEFVKTMRKVNGKIFSVVAYAEKIGENQQRRDYNDNNSRRKHRKNCYSIRESGRTGGI